MYLQASLKTKTQERWRATSHCGRELTRNHYILASQSVTSDDGSWVDFEFDQFLCMLEQLCSYNDLGR